MLDCVRCGLWAVHGVGLRARVRAPAYMCADVLMCALIEHACVCLRDPLTTSHVQLTHRCTPRSTRCVTRAQATHDSAPPNTHRSPRHTAYQRHAARNAPRTAARNKQQHTTHRALQRAGHPPQRIACCPQRTTHHAQLTYCCTRRAAYSTRRTGKQILITYYR